MRKTAIERVLSRIQEDDFGCWLYTGCRDSNGYGNARGPDGKTWKVHRMTFIHFRGEIPEGKELDHLCRVRHCANPDHLDPVTRAEHVLRGLRNQNSAKLTCLRGHVLAGENLRVDRKGKRSCNECNRQRLERNRRAAGVVQRPYRTREGMEMLRQDKVPLILEALAQGESQRSIARRLGVSRRTVQNQSVRSWKPRSVKTERTVKIG